MIKPLPDHGEPIRIVPYDESQCPPGTLFYLWQLLLQTPPPAHFWNEQKTWTPEEAVRFFAPETQRLLLIATTEADPPAVVGVSWLEGIVPKVRAAGHFLFRPQYWGYGRPERLIKQGLDWAFGPPLELKVITCQLNSRNHLALGLLHRLGWKKVGEVPQWFHRPDGGYDSTVLGFFSADTWQHNHTQNGVAHVAL